MRRKLQNIVNYFHCKPRKYFGSAVFQNINKQAFSLIELSIVLVIISIIIAGTLSVSTVAINNAKIKITNERIQEVYKALGNFLLVNKRLPCPASLNIARNSAGYAQEVISEEINCNNSGVYLTGASAELAFGMIPANSLGISNDMAEDAFGSKLMYFVNTRFTHAGYPAIYSEGDYNFGYSITNNGSHYIKVLDAAGGNIVDGISLVIMSYGPNKYGAFNATSSAQSSTTSTDYYEARNYFSNIVTSGENSPSMDIGIIDDNAKVKITSSNAGSSVFDDIVFFKSKNDIVGDFNAMFLIPCLAFTSNSHSYPSVYYGGLSYSTTACTTPSTDTPSYKCGPFGVWSQANSCVVY